MSGPTPEDWKRRMDDSVETSMKILRVTNPRLAARLGDTESARALLESEARERALLESQARRRAIDELIPAEMRAKIKKWAKDNDCPFDEAITRLIGVGLDATKKQALAAPAPRRKGKSAS
jgi:hypothetical protein